MKIFKDKHTLQKEISKNRGISFVPTMGGLHKGHISLIKKSKKSKLKTLVSIFVNPKQFNKKSDFRSYPRNTKKDLKQLKKLKINSSNFDETFSRESVELLYSLPKKSFVLIGDKNNDVYLSKISNINISMLNKDADKVNEYKLKSNSQVMGEIYSTYDLSLSKKYNVKFLTSVFNIKDLDFVLSLSNEAIKIPSHEVYNLELIKQSCSKFKKIFISVGACKWEEFKKILNLDTNWGA